MTNRIKRTRPFFYGLFTVTLIFSYFLIRPYLGVIVFSIVTVVTFKPVYDYLVTIMKGRQAMATTATIIFIFLIIIGPLALVINITIDQATQFANDISTFVSGSNTSLSDILAQINQYIAPIPYLGNYQLTEERIIDTIQSIARPLATFLGQNAVSLGSSAARWIPSLIIFLSLLSALFPSLPYLLNLLKDLSPLDDELDQKYIDRLVAMTKAMFKGVIVIAIIQGLAAGLFFLIAGVPYTFFWTVLAVFLSIVPIGVNVIAIPIGVTLIALGNIWQGIIVLVGCVLIVANIDNVLRPRLVSKDAQLNPALVLLSAFGGLSLFGFLGVIYGPVTMIFLLTTIDIYLENYQLTDEEEAGGT